jgi:hypothetical protein
MVEIADRPSAFGHRDLLIAGCSIENRIVDLRRQGKVEVLV